MAVMVVYNGKNLLKVICVICLKINGGGLEAIVR